MQLVQAILTASRLLYRVHRVIILRAASLTSLRARPVPAAGSVFSGSLALLDDKHHNHFTVLAHANACTRRPSPAAGSAFCGHCGLDPGGTTTEYEELKLTCPSDGDSIASIDFAVWGVPINPKGESCASWQPGDPCGRCGTDPLRLPLASLYCTTCVCYAA